ncbi:PIN domain-containing protein [Bradyrhizobium sp. 6(2017)]|uniref:PIN domain-containing protein n=1 Tax=Bradyrhizobium sp. 6(2017) TaxID=1197460 RepID=UPI0013E1BFEF|nr:PIN domain-containing protein [Bradyrhizobium sp. 6(2017)]QIG96813.1 PIN domain-containing protein [Bradyrhizobium sp. 6(2017)]
MTILLDKNVITNVARGDVATAEALKRILASGEHVYIAHAAYNELVRDSPIHLRMSYEMLLKDLHITTPPAGASSIKDRGDFHADNITHVPARGKPGQIREYGRRDSTTPGDAFVAAEAKALNARLWTLDENLAKRAQNLGVTNLGGVSGIKSRNNPESIAQARKLMGLKPLSMLQSSVKPSKDGSSPPSGGTTKATSSKGGSASPPSSGATTTSKGGGASGAKTKITTAEVGPPIEPVQEHGPSASGDAKFQAATLMFDGVNFVLQKINDRIQRQRFEAEWSRLAPEVRRRLDADPQLGAIVLISYWKDQGDVNSAIDTVAVFQNIQVGYGLTPDDARRDAYSQSSRWTGGFTNVGDQIWLKPKAPPDIKRLKLPFDCTIAGLATFVPGKEKLVRVKFSGKAGFDDKMHSREVLSVPAGMTPRFFYLWPPDKIRYFQERWITLEVDWEMSNDADVRYGDVDPFSSGVPVVKLDSWYNPYNATAAMVWPADNSTANLFQTAGKTQDNLALLSVQMIGPLRWVRPEFIRILKAPFDSSP